MKIAVCEDNKEVAAEIEDYITDLRFKDFKCDVFYDGKELLDYLEMEEMGYQIYLMDIQMPKLNGIKTSEFIRKKDQSALIIFMTDYTEFVFSVFEVLPFRFLPKPVTRKKLQEIIGDALDYLSAIKKFIAFEKEGVRYQVEYHDILFLESDRRKILLHTGNKDYEFYGKLGDIENTLDKNIFIRIHVSFLVNLEHIRKIRKDEIELDNGMLLPMSKKYRESVKEQQINFIKWRSGI